MPLVPEKDVKRAIANVSAFGDTDVFPFPFENWFIKERPDQVLKIIQNIDSDFDSYIEQFPPQFESTLAPAGYTGFRWVTQIDPFWNLYLLSMLISIGPRIEAARLPLASNIAHSYRFEPTADHRIFSAAFGWASFMKESHRLAGEYSYVIATDISEFYRRLNHHRIENSLEHVAKGAVPDRIISILSRFSDGSSYGIPVGGPAARMLSEITINQIDKILYADGIKFVRFADDYHFFTNTLADSYNILQVMSQLLIQNQGLTLQKSKTRIMSSSEFLASFPKHLLPEPPESENLIESETVKLLKLSLNFDPYSSNATENYEKLQSELSGIDIVGLLTAEAQKTQINLSISRKIVSTISHLASPLRIAAVKTLLDNKEQFFPIMSLVLQMVREVMSTSSDKDKADIAKIVRTSIQSDTHVFRLDLHIAYAVRILAESGGEEDLILLNSIYKTAAPFIRRDIILTYAMHDNWEILSNLRSRFQVMTPWEQRAFFHASYALGDEGKHWRDKITLSFPLLDKEFRQWCGSLKTPDALKVRL